jgi:hypothetical protein
VAWRQTSATSGDLSGVKAEGSLTGVALVSASCLSKSCLDQLADLAAWEAELAADLVEQGSGVIAIRPFDHAISPWR